VINASIDTTSAPDGFPVVQVRFDLGHELLAAVALAAAGARVDRHRGQDMTVDDVLAMRRLTTVGDQIGSLAANGLANPVVLAVGDLALLHDALVEWSEAQEAQGWQRAAEADALRTLRPLLWDLGELREQALRAALAGPPETAAA
jgi:hypothetical protein